MKQREGKGKERNKGMIETVQKQNKWMKKYAKRARDKLDEDGGLELKTSDGVSVHILPGSIRLKLTF